LLRLDRLSGGRPELARISFKLRKFGRLPANEVLRREVAPFLTRPVGRPPNRPIVWHHEFMYKAESWTRERRLVSKMEWHKGELFPRVG
jgi:hypothetical protein